MGYGRHTDHQRLVTFLYDRARCEAHEASDELDHGITLAVNTMIEAHHTVYDLSEAKAILGKARKMVVGDCPCRIEQHNCDAPLDVCLSLDEQADISLRHGGNNREVTLNEALFILKRSHEAGLVHMAYVAKGADSLRSSTAAAAAAATHSDL